jgi:hypothetical protein
MTLFSFNFRFWAFSWAAVICLLVAATGGCDWTVDTSAPTDSLTTDSLQTQLLAVRVRPSPIPPGDTATFTAVLADSTDPSFQFRWYLAGVGPVVITDTNAVRWPASPQPGTATHVVVADNGADSLAPPLREFTVEIREATQ